MIHTTVHHCGSRDKIAKFIQKCQYLDPAKTMFEQKLMTNLAQIALINIKINSFYQKIPSSALEFFFKILYLTLF